MQPTIPKGETGRGRLIIDENKAMVDVSLVPRPSHLFNIEKVGGPGDEARLVYCLS